MVNYNTYIGNRKSLKFPVMSDGYITIPYTSNVPNNNPYGIWEISDSFTFQTIVTPYDCNGNIKNIVYDSDKTMPSHANASNQSSLYLPNAQRINQKMTLFYSDNVEIFLQNNTVNTNNNPAEYQIGFRVKIANNDTLYTNNIIVPVSNHTNMNNINDMYEGFQTIRRHILNGAGTAIQSSSYDTFLSMSASSANNFVVGDLLYDIENNLMGSVEQIDVTGTTGIHLSGVYDRVGYNNNNNFKIFAEPLKEPLYVLGNYHIAASFNNATGLMSIFLNGSLVTTKRHKDRRNDIETDFNFSDTSIYIGQNPNAAIPRTTQFMGEIHELAFNDDLITDFPSIYTLFPQRKTLKLYLTFEEAER